MREFTINPRLAPVVYGCLPQPELNRSIYEVQKNLAKMFEKISS